MCQHLATTELLIIMNLILQILQHAMDRGLLILVRQTIVVAQLNHAQIM